MNHIHKVIAVSIKKNIISLALPGGFLLWWFVASFFPGRFTWGFDLLNHYSQGFRLAWFLSGMAMISALHFIPEPGSLEGRPSKSANILLVLLPAGLALYLLLRVKIPLLGDGILRSQEISAGRLFSLTEPLTTLIHGLLYRLLSVLGFQANLAELAYRITSMTAGITTLTLYIFFAKKNRDGRSFWPLIIILAGAGFNLIFYGYVESYGLFLAAVGWYLFLVREKIAETKPSFIPAVLAGLAAALHGSGIFLFPSLVYYWKIRSYFSTKAGLKRTALELLCFSAIPAAALATGFLLVSRPEMNTALSELPKSSLLPLWGGLWGYGILSPGHWLDMFNQFLLVSPAALLLLLWAKPVKGTIEGPAEKILVLAAAAGLFFIFIVDPKLGTARDWDLLAWPFTALLFLAVHRALARKLEWRSWAAAAVVSLWLFLPWVLVNASSERSLARYTSLLARDNRSSAYGYENLAIYYRDHHHPEKEEWAYRMAVDNDSLNPRHIYNYALSLSKNGKYRQSLPWFQRSLELDTRSAKRWNDYGAALINCQEPGPAIAALNQALVADPGNDQALYNLGVAYSMAGNWSAADSFFTLTRLTGYSDAWLYYYWGEVKLNLKQYPEAAEYLKNAIDAGVQEEVLFEEYQKALAAQRGKNR
ncbi:tetratricopeptide repeat protein [candidate division TA06 bacterium]|nr:tetratricopeptide repeat protein [candidate division TA06 bacterium]